MLREQRHVEAAHERAVEAVGHAQRVPRRQQHARARQQEGQALEAARAQSEVVLHHHVHGHAARRRRAAARQAAKRAVLGLLAARPAALVAEEGVRELEKVRHVARLLAHAEARHVR